VNVSDVDVIPRRQGYTLRGTIDDFTLEYHFEGVPVPSGLPRGDAFLAAALLPAMHRGEPLTITAPVSRRLLAGAEQLMAIYTAWFPGARRIAVAAPPAPKGTLADRTAAFFSGGVDSFYTLLKPRPYGEGTPSHLILVHGFDVPIGDAVRFAHVRHRVEQVASATNRGLIVVGTNLRQWSDTIVSWPDYLPGALAGVAHGCHGFFERVLVASTHAYDELVPLGSHPLSDHWWSSDLCELVHDGAEARRSRKIEVIASHAIALAHLRVCWQLDTPAYNCGGCEKCLRTMIGLHLAGALERTESFPKTIDVAAVRRLRPVNESELRFYEDLAGTLTDSPIDRRLKRAVRHMIRRTRARRRSGRLARGLLGPRATLQNVRRAITRSIRM
jgi:hypothetical protein